MSLPASEEIADFADAKWNSAAYADKLDVIVVIERDGLADSRLEFFFCFRHVLCHPISHGISLCFQKVYLG